MSAEARALSRRALLGSLMALPCLRPTAVFARTAPRVASLDYGLSSTLLSLGVVPAGVSDLAGWDKWVVEPPMPAGVADLGLSAEPNLEILARLKPDLILTTPFLDAQLPRLESLARVLRLKTFMYEGTPILQAVTDATRKLAVALERKAEAERVISDMDAFLDTCRERLAGMRERPVALVSFWDARHVRIYSSPGLFHDVIERIGLRNAWTKSSGTWGFQTIAVEELSRIADPDAVLIALEPVPADVLVKLERSPLWRALPFTRPDRFLILPSALIFGMTNEAVRLAGLLTAALERRA